MYRMRAVLAILGACVCFGTLGAAKQIADVDASPVAVGLARVVLGGALLALGLVMIQTAGARERAPATGVPTSAVVGFGAGGVLAYQSMFFLGTSSSGVAVGTVVALGSAPVITGLLEGLLRRRIPSARWFAATSVAVTGVALTSGLVGSDESLTGVGVLWSVGAGACYAVYAVSGKELTDRGWTSRQAMGAMFGVAAAAGLPLLIINGPSWLLSARGLALVLWLGVVATAGGYLLFGWGLARLPTTTVTTLTLAEPLCATLLSLGVLGEHLQPAAAVGVLVIAAGLALLTVPRRRMSVAPAT
jgi:DME family drug/metabolite transporter